MPAFNGPGMILFSNVAAIVTLLALRAHEPRTSVGILAAGNLFCGSMLLLPSLSGRPIIPKCAKSRVAILLWAACYSTTYSLYLLNPKLISLSELIIAQSIAPTAAVVISGDWLKEHAKSLRLATNLCAILILLALAFTRPPGSDQLQPFLRVPLLAALFCALGTCLAARTLAKNQNKEGPIFWAQSRVAFLNGCVLAAFIGIVQHSDVVERFGLMLQFGTLIGLGILTTQSSFLFGLANTPPLLSALMMSAAVPLSLVTDAALNQKTVGTGEITLSLLYCCCIWISGRIAKIRNSRPTE